MLRVLIFLSFAFSAAGDGCGCIDGRAYLMRAILFLALFFAVTVASGDSWIQVELCSEKDPTRASHELASQLYGRDAAGVFFIRSSAVHTVALHQTVPECAYIKLNNGTSLFVKGTWREVWCRVNPTPFCDADTRRRRSERGAK